MAGVLEVGLDDAAVARHEEEADPARPVPFTGCQTLLEFPPETPEVAELGDVGDLLDPLE